jgi:hypothetical protein
VAKLFRLPQLQKLAKLLWGLLLASLPVTTFRYLPSFYGTTLVRPMALIPLSLLVPLILYLAWKKRRALFPQGITPLTVFLFMTLAATLIGALYAPVETRGHAYWERALRAWVSLGVGLTFFLAASWMSRSEEDLKHSLHWLYLGLYVTILWGTLQIIAVYTPLLSEDFINQVQGTFSIRGLAHGRIPGLAYEPSWLADQIVILYFPWLVAALLSGYRLTRFKWLEPVLILLAGGILVFSYSRSGILTAALVTVLVLLLTNRSWLPQIAAWFTSPFRGSPAPGRSNLPSRLGRLAIAMLLLTSIAGAFFFLSQQRYFASLWQADLQGGLVEYLRDIFAGSRLAYGWSSLTTFATHPWSGVGLGASGFYMFENMPDWALTVQSEIAQLMSPQSMLFPNTKSLYVRLLAETGLLGFWAFVGFYFTVLAAVRHLLAGAEPYLKYCGLAGLYIWLAAGVRNFTQDSLTFPIMWVSLGILLGHFSYAKLSERQSAVETGND